MMKLSPSILSADFAHLARDIKTVEEAGVEYLHIDVMDGHFVPNISIGAPVVKDIRKYSALVFDVHLMISDPSKYLDNFIKAGADIITFHMEAEKNVETLIARIKKAGIKASVSVKPGTPVETVFPYLDTLDMVLIMTVEPGFGGQSFLEDMMDKVVLLRREIDKRGLKTEIEIDGGANLSNIGQIVKAGVDVVVAGSAIFCAEDVAAAVQQFRKKAE